MRKIGEYLYDTMGMPTKDMVPGLWKQGIRHLVISNPEHDIIELHDKHADFIMAWMKKGGTHEIADASLESEIIQRKTPPKTLKGISISRPCITEHTKKKRGVLLIRRPRL